MVAITITSALYVLGAWVFWGTYPVPFKLPAAQKANTDPFAFQFMKSMWVCITSWLILTWRPFYFTYWGFVGAALWIPAGLLFITSVKCTGVAFATPIANGIQVIVSFCWGVFLGEVVHNVYLSVLAMVIMIIGMTGISISVNYEKIKAARLAKQKQQLSINVAVERDERTPLFANTPLIDQIDEEYPYQNQNQNQKAALFEKTPLIDQVEKPGYQKQRRSSVNEHQIYKIVDQPTDQENKAAERAKFIFGIICAISAGFFGGSQNVPLRKAPPQAHGIEYVISFGIGAVLVITVFTILYVCWRLTTRRGLPTVNLRLSFVPGTMAGLLWSAGNICNIYATLEWGQTVGFPLVMCNMMVAGIWGVFYYNEAPSVYMKALFLASCATLLGGVTMLSHFG